MSDEIRKALAPVMDWYQSDECDPRPLADIVGDVVADLQEDRTQALLLHRIVLTARMCDGDQAHCILPNLWPLICEADKMFQNPNQQRRDSNG